MESHYIETMVTIGFLGALIWGMLKFLLRDIHKDLTELKAGQNDLKLNMNRNEMRIDHLFEENNRLYKILIDLVQKDKK